MVTVVSQSNRGPGLLDVAELYAEHRSAVRQYFERRMGRDAAEDLTQTVFLHVLRAADRYHESGQVRGWLFTVARNVLYDELGYQARRPPPAFEGVWGGSTSDAGNDRHVTRLMLADALARLTPAQRACIVRRFFLRERAEAMARAEGCRVEAIRSRQRRATATLGRLIGTPG